METNVTADETWACGSVHALSGVVFVSPGVTLTIEPGALVVGSPRTALVVQRGARLVANGTMAEPIVFTSANPEGMRARADWGGVVLLGAAPVNLNTVPDPDAGVGDGGLPPGEGRIEGLPETDLRTRFGGSDPTHDCGSLRYARIEFAGFEFAPMRELNGLTLGGCGSRTRIEHVQVHMGSDDGIEAFGGTVNLRNIVISRAADDGFDWDNGYRGQVQFLIVQQDSDARNANHGLEGDNIEAPFAVDAQPRSRPTIYNATLIGSGATPLAMDADPERGILVRRGSHMILRNSLVMNFPAAAVNVASAQSAAGFAAGEMTIENTLFFRNGAGGMGHFPPESGAGDDDGFDEAMSFNAPMRANVFDVDPRLPRPTDLTSPSFVPPRDSPAARGAAPPPAGDFFDPLVNYLGAIAPGGPDWTAGWTAFPNN
jgi:hypothetical protein